MQEKDIPEAQKKIGFCFRAMSRSFADPIKAEESFQILDQLQDANIWKILTDLVDPNTSFHQTCVYRVIYHLKLIVVLEIVVREIIVTNCMGIDLWGKDMLIKSLKFIPNSCGINL